MPGLPGQSFLQGVNIGSSMFQRLLQPYIAREQMRLAHQLDPIRAQLLQEQVQGLQNENNPNYYQGLAESILGTQGAQAQANQPNQGAPLQQNRGYSPQDLQGTLFTAPQLSSLNNVQNPAFKAPMQAPEGFLEDMNEDVNTIPEHAAKEIAALPPAKNAVDELAKRLFIKKKFGIDLGRKEGGVLQGAAREATDLERVKQLYGEDSPVYQMAKENYDLKEQRKEALARKAEQAIGGLKTGDKWMKDEEGNIIGIESQPTKEEKNKLEGRAFFNEVYPVLSAGLNKYAGKGSITQFASDANSYNVDPAATQRIDDYLLGQKLVSSAYIKEAATLAAGKQKEVYRGLKNSIDSSDIPQTQSRLTKEYLLPQGAFAKADTRFNEILNQATESAEKSVPAFIQKPFKRDVAETDSNGSILIRNQDTGEEKMVSREEAKRLGAL